MNARMIVASALILAMSGALAQDATYSVKLLTPETALRAAQAALAKCRTDGFQVSVAVVDRAGVTQVLLRDRYAGPHTVKMAADKAWTAVSFRTSTTDIARATQPGSPQSGIRNRPRVAAVGGGIVIEGGGALLGGLGVSGAPRGEADEACARAGTAAIQDSIEF
jgi:uncharacterized protein GlcG (DUF336 family)